MGDADRRPSFAPARPAPVVSQRFVSRRMATDIDAQPVAPRPSLVTVASHRNVSLAVWLFSFWICGVIWCSARLFLDWRRAQCLRRTGIEMDPQEAISRWAELARIIGLRRMPPILASGFIDGPLVLGIFRPAILLPTALGHSPVDEGLRLKLALVAMCSVVTCSGTDCRRQLRTLFFFHPLVWLAWRNGNLPRAACDELVYCRTGAAPVDYAAMLVAASVHSGAGSGAGLMAVGVLGSYQTLRRRLIL